MRKLYFLKEKAFLKLCQEIVKNKGVISTKKLAFRHLYFYISMLALAIAAFVFMVSSAPYSDNAFLGMAIFGGAVGAIIRDVSLLIRFQWFLPVISKIIDPSRLDEAIQKNKFDANRQN